MKRDIKKDEVLINRFFDKREIHIERDRIEVLRGKKSTYKVIVHYKNRPSQNVNFWINNETISYGALPFGIFASADINTL